MVLQAVREDRMPGGRNSGAVYNLYKVCIKMIKTNNFSIGDIKSKTKKKKGRKKARKKERKAKKIIKSVIYTTLRTM